ncbi:MAG: hypothetical protein PHW04_11825 [Candidatus Wallbacteria bacterium]|nr:hypothetical protein [Candidatus Wallbacteria bacterium]
MEKSKKTEDLINAVGLSTVKTDSDVFGKDSKEYKLLVDQGYEPERIEQLMVFEEVLWQIFKNSISRRPI